jgi:hypothetical protein
VPLAHALQRTCFRVKTIPSLAERIEGAISDGRTEPALWRELPAEKSDKWAFRAERAAALLNGAGVTSVLELGCFRMSLERFLAPGTAYLPSDLVRRDARTIVCDLNAEPVPVVQADAVAALGVLEHLAAPAEVMARLSAHYPLAVVTYNPLDLVPLGKPRRHFLNDFTRDEVAALLSRDWRIVHEEVLGHQLMFLLQSRNTGQPPAK